MNSYRATGLSILVGALIWVAGQPKSPSPLAPEPPPAASDPPKRKPLLPLPRRPRGTGDGAEAGQFVAAGPVSPFDHTSAVVADLVATLRKHNVGGRDGAGLCVFTSIMHAARYQNETRLWDFQAQMQREPGGGYPQKVDAMIQKYGPGVGYVQHTGGDASFLELALKTGRMVSVTYNGRDSRYRGPIAHMVNLAYLDQSQAAILDNNYPDQYLWMGRSDYLDRWHGTGGGWAVVLLGPPPAPVPHN